MLSLTMRPTSLLLALPLLCLVATGCTHLEGQFAARAPELGGTWTMTPDNCMAGSPQGYHGVRFVSEEHPGLSVIFIDDIMHGQALIVRDRARKIDVVFKPEQCQLLSGELRSTGVRVNGVRALDGKLQVECRAGAEGSFSGNIVFEKCSV